MSSAFHPQQLFISDDDMEKRFALFALCEQNPIVISIFPCQMPVIWSFIVFVIVKIALQMV